MGQGAAPGTEMVGALAQIVVAFVQRGSARSVVLERGGDWLEVAGQLYFAARDTDDGLLASSISLLRDRFNSVRCVSSRTDSGTCDSSHPRRLSTVAPVAFACRTNAAASAPTTPAA